MVPSDYCLQNGRNNKMISSPVYQNQENNVTCYLPCGIQLSLSKPCRRIQASIVNKNCFQLISEIISGSLSNKLTKISYDVYQKKKSCFAILM